MNLVAYGTLLYPEVMQALTGRSVQALNCHLAGFSRFCLHNLPYPGLIRSDQPGESIDVCLYLGLEQDEIKIIDLYEGEQYERCLLPTNSLALNETSLTTVEQSLKSEHNLHDAQTFVYLTKVDYSALFTSSPWSPSIGRAELKRIIDECREVRAEYYERYRPLPP